MESQEPKFSVKGDLYPAIIGMGFMAILPRESEYVFYNIADLLAYCLSGLLTVTSITSLLRTNGRRIEDSVAAENRRDLFGLQDYDEELRQRRDLKLSTFLSMVDLIYLSVFESDTSIQEVATGILEGENTQYILLYEPEGALSAFAGYTFEEDESAQILSIDFFASNERFTEDDKPAAYLLAELEAAAVENGCSSLQIIIAGPEEACLQRAGFTDDGNGIIYQKVLSDSSD